ncbi:Haloacid dehalogenase domain protein hydrolase [Micromonospora sp. L5]|nr:HAD family hydrolase [Micromonospora sp. L5]ADU06379.1 Haloacid dehalogenase domain protein hydrolase [Micromonospora sp. L5]
MRQRLPRNHQPDDSCGRPFVLFDLDGTLIRPGSSVQRAHMGAMADAVRAATGLPILDFTYQRGHLSYAGVDLAGCTDAGTIRVMLRRHRVSDRDIDGLLPTIVASMPGHLGPLEAGGPGDLLPGVRVMLARLQEAGIALGMCTGNAAPVARWKMSRTNLADLLIDGGFGDRAVDRDDIVVAASDAVAGGCRCGVLIGDTVKDITAAHRAGLRAVGVTTGPATVSDLLAAGADAVLDGLADGFGRVAALLAPVGRAARVPA